MSGPRVVVVGAGLMGRWHADAARHAGAQIVAIVDRDLSRAQALAGTGAMAFSSLDAALATNPEVAHICTALDSHTTLARSALAAGCHLIVEKPVTPDAGEAEALLASARLAGRELVPVHQFRFQDGVQEILARRAALGPIRQIEFATCSAGADSDRAGERDQIAAEIAPHAFSLARAILGNAVGELPWHLERAAAGEWRFSTTTDQGCTISGMISLSARPTFATCRVFGEGGSALADLFQGYATFEPGTASRNYKVLRPLAVSLGTAAASATQLATRAWHGERAYPGLRALCAASYRAFSTNGPAPFAADELVDVARARDRLIALAASH
ncbi:MAG: Gfo/Idh/MocA family oxidoreductase [Gemmatimonadales bacterium]